MACKVCVCGNAPPSTLTASTSLSSSSTSSWIVFVFFLPFLSNTAENVVILRSLRFVSFLIYSMAGSMWVHPLFVCECHSFAHMPQCTTTTTWPKVLGHIKTKTKAQAEADQVTFLLTLLQLQRKVENKKKMEQKSFLARKIKQKIKKKTKRNGKQNEAKLKLLLNWSLWSWVTDNSTRSIRKKRCKESRPNFHKLFGNKQQQQPQKQQLETY